MEFRLVKRKGKDYNSQLAPKWRESESSLTNSELKDHQITLRKALDVDRLPMIDSIRIPDCSKSNYNILIIT